MFNLNKKQESALSLVMSGHNLLIIGAAGTGKSFLVHEIVRRCADKGVRVSLTCTTGIACAVYEHIPVKAKTIHQWSGIDDGRYSPSEIKDVINNNAKYAETVNTIRNTDLLIIDECSMLSKTMFNSLSEVCSLKNEKLLFGGIQLVLCGDFFQLPPVPNPLYNEDGEFCFTSKLFSNVLRHRVTLTDVVRQTECQFIKAIQEVSRGTVSNETADFMANLNRPLQNGDDSIKLFSTNDHVDDFNRNSLIDFPGPVYQYISNDSGESRFLSHILAPHILWLKIGAPVILLRNLSDKLVNGLRGEVYDIDDNGPVVEFPSIQMKVPIEKMKFSVFSPRQNRDIAVREQLPLKLAYALTIHKSQGMTLDSVEVDCDGIFKPGQLGVAIGRARTSAGLRVINFSPRVCMQHQDTVTTFVQIDSEEPSEDMSCCQVRTRLEQATDFYTVQDMLTYAVDADIDINCEEEFDEEFDNIIEAMNFKDNEIELPQELDLDMIKEKLKTEEVLTPFQYNTNSILNNLDTSKYTQFCQREYKQIVLLTDKMKFEGPVKCKNLGQFYSSIHEHHNSAEFIMSCMLLFENEPFTAEHKHICFNISVELRKFVLSKRSEVYPSSARNVSERSVTNASRARIRYIGGYCIAKIRYKLLNKKNALRYSKSVEGQQSYDEAVYATRVINNLREDEQFILGNSIEPESLLDTTRKQNVNRGLTNISDELFNFFIKLSQICLNLMSSENFNKCGSTFFESCKQKIIENMDLFQCFSSVLEIDSVGVKSELSVREVNVDKQKIISTIFQKIIKMYLLVLFGQFRKDLLEIYDIGKKMAHRKQIRVSKPAGKKTSNKLKLTKNEGDKSTECDEEVEEKCGIRRKRNNKRKKVSPSSHSRKLQSAETETCDTNSTQPVTSETNSPLSDASHTVSAQEAECPKAGTSQTHSPLPSAQEELDEDSDTLCKKCWTKDRDTEWIQCDNCSAWLHRGCAGLRHHMKWKKFQKKGSVFNCNECL